MNVEKYLQEQEKKSKFTQVSAKTADFVLRKHSMGVKLTPEQLARAAAELEIPLKNDKITRYRDFFQAFRSEGFYSETNLLVALILLGQGTQMEKTELLFEIFDEKCSNELSSRTVRTLVSSVLQVAIVKVPILTRLPSDGMETEVCQHLDFLRARLRDAVARLTALILEEKVSISLSDLVKAVGSCQIDITNCGSLRTFAYHAGLKRAFA